MFGKAFGIAAGYTRPVVVSSRTVNGECHSSVGAYVVVDRDGWFLTAAHLFGLIQQQIEAARTYRQYRSDVRDMDHDVASKRLYRKKKIRHFDVPRPESVRDHSTWWGMDGVQACDVQVAAAADLALGRLEPFDPATRSRSCNCCNSSGQSIGLRGDLASDSYVTGQQAGVPQGREPFAGALFRDPRHEQFASSTCKLCI